MEITGTIVQMLPLQTGEGKNGPWKKQDFILETQDQYPKKVCISAWGDKIDQFNLQENAVITASINIESREFNSKWYTDVKVWKVEGQSAGGAPQSKDAPPPHSANDMPADLSSDDTDDLPF